MSELPFVPYEGPEPYIFVSYAHANKDKVYPIIKQLHEMGYRLWYDEGIKPGKEWGDEVQRHLENATLMLLFLSPVAVERKNVRSETQFAWSKDIPILCVDLVETKELKYGLALWLSLTQRVLFYSYTDEEQFYEKLQKGLPKKTMRPEPTPEPLPASKPEPKVKLEKSAPKPVPVISDSFSSRLRYNLTNMLDPSPKPKPIPILPPNTESCCYCGNCGAKNPANNNYCFRCGQYL